MDMGDQAAKDATARQRIISHMNADHHDSVIRYLEHYHQVSSYSACAGRMTDISLSQMTFSCGGQTYHIPFQPAMATYREARERVVEMDKECVSALGRSDITVREWIPPYGWYMALFITVSVTFVAFSRRANFAPSGILGAFLPDVFRRFCWTVQPFVLYPMLILHTLEMLHMMRGRLTKHNVNVCDPVFWKWAGDTFIEGVGAYQRFDNLIEEKRVQKEKQKH